jgi:hypothetical protein
MGYMVLTYNKLIIEYNIINITEILLKVALNTTTLTLKYTWDIHGRRHRNVKVKVRK